MKIRVDDIEETGKALAFGEEIEELNELFARARVVDYQFLRAVDVNVTYYRSGVDLFFEGRLSGAVTGNCARCLESYPFAVEREFTFVLKPAVGLPPEPALSEEDLALSFYSGDEIDLSPLIREEMILSLPTRPLCREACSGLCPRCGANRNRGSCECRDEPDRLRLGQLRELKLPPR